MSSIRVWCKGCMVALEASGTLFESGHSDQKGMPSALKGGYQRIVFNSSTSPSERESLDAISNSLTK